MLIPGVASSGTGIAHFRVFGQGTGIATVAHESSFYMKKRKEIRISFWDINDNSPLFIFRRGAERRNKRKELIIEVLKLVHPQKPTKDNLQRLSKIRRCDFLKALYALMDKEVIFKSGAGTKSDPYVYELAHEYIEH